MKSTSKALLLAGLTSCAAAKEPYSADYPHRISIVGTRPVSVDSGTYSVRCTSSAGAASDITIETNCVGREGRQTYIVVTGIATSSTLRFEMVRLNWAGDMKTTGPPLRSGLLGLAAHGLSEVYGGGTIKPGDYFFRFVDGNTIEVLNGKNKSRFTLIALCCTRELSGICKAGEKLNVLGH